MLQRDEPWKHYKTIEGSNLQKAVYGSIPFIWNIQSPQIHRDIEADSWLPGAGRSEEWGVTA